MANTKRWSYKAGEKGRNRVRVYEDAKSGRVMLEWWEDTPGDPKPRRRTKALGHSDRERAKEKADEVAAALASSQWDGGPGITLSKLFHIYGCEVTPTKSVGKQKHDRSCSEMFLRFLGPERPTESLSVLDWNRFVQERRAGKVGPRRKREAAGVRNRQVAYDLKWLLAVLNWATVARQGNGKPILAQNPLKGLPIPKEESPNRPMMTNDRFEAMLSAASSIDWRFELALILARETGHRIGAIRRMRWSDVDFASGHIRWRGDSDKIGFEHTVPATETALTALRRAQHRSPAIGGAWVFPSPKDTAKPCSRHLMRDWWDRGEDEAELTRVRGLGWHSLRRLFATELKDVPLGDLCYLGGWKDPTTVLKCYQKPDEGTMREALRRRRQVGQ